MEKKKKKSQILFLVKKDDFFFFFFHPGWEAGGGWFLFCFWFCFFLCFCFSHVYSARSVEGERLGKGRAGKGGDGGFTGHPRGSARARKAEFGSVKGEILS